MWIAVLILAVVTGSILYIRKVWGVKTFTSFSPFYREKVYEQILRSISDTVLILDKSLKVLKIYNPGCVNLGIPAPEIPGKDVRRFLGENIGKQWEEGIRFALEKGEVYEMEYACQIGGEKLYFEGRFLHIQKDRVACFVRDITKRKKSEMAVRQNEVLLSAVLDHMPMPVMLKDIDAGLRYIYWNLECDRQAGFNREKILGKTDPDIYGKERGGHYQEIDRKVIREGKPYRQQEVFITPDGKEHVSIVTKNIISNELHHWLLVTRWDVSDLHKAQSSLKELNRELYLAFSAANVAPWMWDTVTDRFVVKIPEFKRVNKGFRIDQDGQSLEEVLASIHPDDRLEAEKLLSALKERQIAKANFLIRYDVEKKFEEYYEVSATVETLDGNGKVIRVVGTMKNVTERQQAEKELLQAKKEIEQVNELNKLILDNTTIGFVFISPDFRIQWGNGSARMCFPLKKGYQEGEFCYKSLYNRDKLCEDCIVEKAIKTGMPVAREKNFEDGSVLDIVARPVYEEGKNLLGVVLKIEDITLRKQEARELQMAKEEAEKSDKLKSAFLANMSHEIRTPLNAILGFSELLFQEANPDQQQKYLEIVRRNNDRLLKLINDILDLSKIEAGTVGFVFSEIEINAVLKDLEKEACSWVETGKPLKIRFVPALEKCVMKTDEKNLTRVISHLVNNAIKFTPEGEILFGYRTEAEGLYFYVRDTGEGIILEKQKEIFERFVKLDKFKDGTGLGLALCRAIVEKLGGRIGVQSEPGKGSEFWFVLPV